MASPTPICGPGSRPWLAASLTGIRTDSGPAAASPQRLSQTTRSTRSIVMMSSSTTLDAFDPQLRAGSFGHLPDMRDIRGHDGVPTADGAFHHGDVDDVIVA